MAWMTPCLAALSGQAPKPEGSRRLRREGLTAKARAEHNHFAMMRAVVYRQIRSHATTRRRNPRRARVVSADWAPQPYIRSIL
jgi:hypothetical protein